MGFGHGRPGSGILVAGLIGVLLSAHAGSAQARPTLVLKNLRAEVEIIPESRPDFAASVSSNGSDDAAPLVTASGAKMTVQGDAKDTEVRGYRYTLNLQPRMDVALEKQRSHRPRLNPGNLTRIVIHAPLSFEIKSSAYVFGHVGPSQSLVIRDNGDGEWIVDKIDRDVDVYGYGDANFRLSTSGVALFDLMGTGNLSSGDVQRLLLNVYGSGDVSVAAVRDDAEITIGGIGDFTAQSIDGKLRVEMEDAGTVRVLDGTIARLTIRSLDGLGSVDVGGTVKDADISIGTKTDVHLHRVTGKVSRDLREAARLRIDDP